MDPAIIDADLFAAVQAKLAANARRQGPEPTTSPVPRTGGAFSMPMASRCRRRAYRGRAYEVMLPISMASVRLDHKRS